MKLFVLSLFLLFCCISVNAQDSYYVSVVKGKVLKANGTVIKTGNKILPTEKIRFTAITDQLVLLNPKTGKVTISPQQSATEKNASLTGFIKDYLKLSSSQERLSAKSESRTDREKKENEALAKSMGDSARKTTIKKNR